MRGSLVRHRGPMIAAGLCVVSLLLAVISEGHLSTPSSMAGAGAASAVPATSPSASSSTSSSAAGAPVPFTEYAAIDARTNGTVLAPNYNFGTLASEATGRQAVQLIGQGQYVQFTLTQPANAVDFHYAIPDSPDGAGLTDPLSLYVGNTLDTSMTLTSADSWLYGAYPFTNTPGVGGPDRAVPHDFYNDVRTMFPSVLPAGTAVKLQVDAGDNAPWYVINSADFENVAAPVGAPAGYIDVTQAPYHADDTGAADATQPLQNAINAAEQAGTGVFLPEGTYKISSPLSVQKVSVAGAGEWYTELTGTHVEFSNPNGSTGSNVDVSDLSMFGDVNVRNDSDGTVSGFNGGFSHSTISDVWVQNEKVGAWINGPSTAVTFKNMRIQDTTANGINFDGGVTNSTVEDSFLRNTQDDGLAMWSDNTADSGDTFADNTVDSPGLANNIAIYGGSDNTVSDNLVQDTVTRGGGIQVANRFGAVALSGKTTISGNKLVRAGQFDPGLSFGVGAIWFYAADSDMTGAIDVTGNEIDQSPYEAFQFLGSNAGKSSNTINNVTISNDAVSGVGTYVFQDQTGGSASVSGVTAIGVGVAGVENCSSGMTLTGGNDSGWSTTTCGLPAAWPLWAYPDTVTFENGSAVPSRQVSIVSTAITNSASTNSPSTKTAGAAATLGTITASNGFTVTADPAKPCGTSLAASTPGAPGHWCQVDISFTGSAAGITTGTLSIPSNQPGGPTSVRLVAQNGTSGAVTTEAPSDASSPSAAPAGTSPSGTPSASAPASSAPTTPTALRTSSAPVLPAGNEANEATITASGSTAGHPPSNVEDGDTSTYWESTDDAFPQWLKADLGSVRPIGTIVLGLPPSTAWQRRVQTITVEGSSDGGDWTGLVGPTGYTFDPASGNTVDIRLAVTNERYVRLVFTANTGWPAGELSELQIYAN